MKITTTTQRKTYVSSRVKQPAEKINPPVDTFVQQNKIDSNKNHIGALADIVKTICDLGILTGTNENINIDLKEVKNVSLFVKQLSPAEKTANEKLPGILAKTESNFTTTNSLDQVKANLDHVKLSIEEYIVPGMATSAIPDVTLSLIDLGNKGIDFWQADPSTPPVTYVRQGAEAANSMFRTLSELNKAAGGESVRLGQVIQVGDFAIQGFKTKETFDDPNASSYKKIYNSLQTLASGVEVLAGTIGGWEKVKQIAGVVRIGLTLADKVVMLTVEEEGPVLR